MKKILIFFVILIASISISFSQAPYSFNYQAVVKNPNGTPLENANVDVEIIIWEGNIMKVYCESQSASTNDKGLFTLVIGNGSQCAPNTLLSSIDWALGGFSMEINVVDSNGFAVSGESPLLAVPYALHAETVTNKDDADADPANEIQTIGFNTATKVLSLSGGGQVDLANISPWEKNGSNIYFPNKVGVKNSNPVFDLDVNGSIATNNIYSHNWQNGMNNILISGTSNKDLFLRFRMGGGGNSGKAGVVFSRFNTRHYFLHNSNDVLSIGHSIQDSNNPDVNQSTEIARFSGFSHKLKVFGSACATSWAICSDQRYKKEFQKLESALEKLLQLEGLYYYLKVEEFPEMNFSKDKQIGVIAQDVEKIFPELVKTDEEGYKSVDYAKISAILIEALKEQQQIISRQEVEITSIKSTNAQVIDRLEALENIINLPVSVSQKSVEK